ncbi:MAG: daunorubicin/doxorubicin transport system permease protein [Thermoanaerobacterium sp.]|nr:daunorubicin/doxorubicin transport system permease protein [Thermoanaerobacterium sp.]MDN5315926.1 daunorubicin/doxorubicin transport system permease protein [Thermoanaerobacterium sp.]
MKKTAIIPANERDLKNRVSLDTAIENTFTFAYRTLLKTVHNPESLLDVTLMPILFTLMFTYLFGGAIAGGIASYLPIIIPGILIQTCITSCGNAGSQLREDIDKSIFNRFKSMPIARISPLAGVLTADLLRYAIAGAVVFIVGAIIGYRPGFLRVIASIEFMMFVGWCLSWLFAFVALTAKSVSSASMYAMLIMFPLTFLSNAFVPTETMPKVVRYFAEHINPVSKAITAVREILGNGAIGMDFWLALVGSLTIFIVFVPLTLWAYNRNM